MRRAAAATGHSLRENHCVIDTLSPADATRRRDLIRMKSLATGLLVLVAVIYILARQAEDSGVGWAGYVRAAAEAGMVGALADWFAVTALFRHPLGLPIPHTAIIPAKKDQLGASLGEFVGANFLNEEVIRERIRSANVAGRVGGWLLRPGSAERVSAEAAAAVRGLLEVLNDDTVRDVIEKTLQQRLAAMQVGPPLGRILAQVVDGKAHHGLVDLGADHVYEWLLENEAMVIDLVASQAPTWSPRFVDERVAQRLYLELVRVSGDVSAEPFHPLRAAIDRVLRQLAVDLQDDPAMRARADAIAAQILAAPAVRRSLGDLWTILRTMVMGAVEDPRSELRQRVDSGLVRLGERLVADEALRARVDGWLEDAAAHVATRYGTELTTTITDTVARWDGREAARRIEVAVGRDLQFIRINGTVVGALAGLAIYIVSNLIW